MHLRRSVRLPVDAYDGGLHFVTLGTHGRQPLFGRVRGGEVDLATAGRIAREEWLWTPELRPSVVADAFVVMPDRVHLLFGIAPSREGVPDESRGARRGTARGAPAGEPRVETGFCRRSASMAPATVSAIVRAYTSAVTRAVNLACCTPGTPVWQRGYHDRVVRTDREADVLRRYIAENPARWRRLRQVA